MKKKYTYISLFSSAGVGCYGFKMENFDCIATSELLTARLNIQKYNNKCKYDNGYILGDIAKDDVKNKLYEQIEFWKKNENLKNVDVVIATPPCQGMSVANYKKNNETARNSLVVEAIEIIENISPNIFIFENVSAFMKTDCVDKDNDILTIRDCINKHLDKNYYIYSKVINFKDYGVPSSRPRTIVIGTRKSLKNISPLNIFPLSQDTITVRDVIGNLKRLDYGEIDCDDIYHFFREYPIYMQEWISSIKEGESAFDESNPVKPYKIENGKKVLLKGSYMGNKFRRMFWDSPAPCIATRNDQLASQSTIHPEDDRVLSIRELMKVMTIPDTFRWTNINIEKIKTLVEKKKFLKSNELNIRRSIGEAVPTEIMRAMAFNIRQMLDFENYVENISRENDSENFYINSYKVEMGLDNVKETGSFYTPQSVVFDTLCRMELNKEKLTVLEPSVGMGAFIPQLLRLVGEISDVTIDLIDNDEKVLNRLKSFFGLLNYTKSNVKLNYICHDFLTYNSNKKYDLIIGNPPYVKLNASELKNYRLLFEDKTISNLFGFFMDKCSALSDEIALIIPKTFLMTPEFNELRKKYEAFNIVSIIDFGVCFFKSVFVEIISVHFKKGYFKNIYIENKREGLSKSVKQGYIYHDKSWLIYRDDWFDNYIKTLKLNVFDFYRDRQITNKYLLDFGKIRVLKSKNLLDNGDIINIMHYDKYINDVDMFNVKKYMNEENIIMTNFTYNIRATYLPKDTIVNGSLAILTPKNSLDKDKINLSLYSTDDFRKYYAIVKNNSKFTINIDANSIYYIGVKYD